MTFIRAPYISDSDQEVEILSTVNGKAVAAQFQNQLVTAFHPELTKDCTVHAHFLQLVSNTLPQKAAADKKTAPTAGSRRGFDRLVNFAYKEAKISSFFLPVGRPILVPAAPLPQ